MQTSLFVYGTLMSAHESGGILAGVGRQDAWVLGRLYDLPAGYPALVLQYGAGEEPYRVHGELAGPFDEAWMAMLDLYEGTDEGLYERRLVDVHVETRVMRAWVYTMDPARARHGRLVPDGQWRPRRRR